MRFRFHLEDKPWNGIRRLFISTEEGSRYAVIAPLQLTVVEGAYRYQTDQRCRKREKTFKTVLAG